jgi:hypothetical protein
MNRTSFKFRSLCVVGVCVCVCVCGGWVEVARTTRDLAVAVVTDDLTDFWL